MNIHTFAHDIILMQNVAHEMTVVESVHDMLVDLGGEFFEPLAVIAPQRDIQRQNIFDLVGMDIVIADGGTGGGKAVQACDLALARGAGKEIGLAIGKGRVR